LLNPRACPCDYFPIEIVDIRVCASNFEAELDVFIRERNENVAKHRERRFSHLHKRGGIAIAAALDHSNDALRNALAHIRNALEFIRDAHRGQDQTKITRHWASEREKAHALGFELELHLIDFSVACAYLSREFNIAVANDFDHTRNTLFNERAEREQIATKVDDPGLQIHGHAPILRDLYKWSDGCLDERCTEPRCADFNQTDQ
jgi:hypothetical protein